MFVDDTRSVAGPDDRKRWQAEALAYIDKLAACDTLGVWWIDDATRTAAPVTSVACGAPLPDDATLDERLKSERDLSQAKEAAAAGVRRALERRSSAQTTDVIGAFARVTLRAGHFHEIVLFTDAVNETPEINLATKRLPSGDALGALAVGVVERRRWEPSMLADTKVFFLLSSTESGQRAPLNSVDALEGFYRALLAKLGAVVVHFGNQPAFTGT
jgi:hypothetical protein